MNTYIFEGNLHHLNMHKENRQDYEIEKSQQKFSNILSPSDNRKKYDSLIELPFHIKYNTHHGQRKLLMNEIDFLNHTYEKWKNLNKVYVVYVGSASGKHLNIIFDMYFDKCPNLIFHLYDKSKFDKNVTEYEKDIDISNKRVFIYSEYFYPETSNRYVGKNVLLISDLRTTTIQTTDEEESNKTIKEDNALQYNIHKSINPIVGMYKFRLPFDKNYTDFMDGEIHLQPWVSNTSTEARLISNGRYTKWDNKKHEEQMFYFNMIRRQKYYEHDNKLYCHCWDCTCELTIIKQYHKIFKIRKNIDSFINELFEKINESVGRNILIERTIYASRKHI